MGYIGVVHKTPFPAMSSLSSSASLSAPDTVWTLQSPVAELEEAAQPLTLTATSALTTTWARGITVSSDGTVSGWYDANKEWGGVDNLMCWAAAASNMIAWWQNTYDTVSYSYTSSVPTDAEKIFQTLKDNWANVGGMSSMACEWWLSGDGRDSGSYIGAPAAGGYYERVDTSNVVSSYNQLAGAGAKDTARLLASEFTLGGIVELSIGRYNGSSIYNAHAITLWGVTVDEATGYLTSVHVTDSDDAQYGILTVDVVYDSWSGHYVMQGSRFSNYYIYSYDAMRSFTQTDKTAPSAPSGLSATVNGSQLSLSWSGVQDASGVRYNVQLMQLVGNTWYIRKSFLTTETSLSTTYSETGTMMWRVNAEDGAGNTSSWGSSNQLEYTSATPSFTFEVAKVSELETNKTAVTLSWSGSSGLTYTLKVGGKVYQLGSATTKTLELADGIYDYTITATDAAGNSTTRRGDSFTCDTIAPPSPDGLKVTVRRGQAVLSWDPVEDATGIRSYVVGYYAPGGSGGVYDYNVTGTSYTLNLTEEGEYSWVIAARDGANKYSSWVYGNDFTVDLTAPVLTLKSATRSKLGTGSTRVSFSWSANETSTYTLTLNGKTYNVGSATSYALTLGDGAYSYSVTAMDASGNSSVVQGTGFTLDTTAPTLTMSAPTQQKVSSGKSSVSFSWQSNETASYVLKVDSTSYTLSGTSTTLSLADGLHSYTLTATDASGNSSTKSGSFRTDTTAPTLPASPGAQMDAAAGQVLLSWAASTDVSSVSYDLAYKAEGASSYTYSYGLSGTSTSLSLAEGSYTWGVRAKDSLGNTTSWVWADTLYVDYVPPTLTVESPTWTKLSSGKSSVTFRWACDETATYVLTLDGESRSLGGTSATLRLDDGLHRYSFTATDLAGNTSTKSGSFRTDTIAPAKPASATATLQPAAGKVSFSWASVYDVSGVVYDIAYRQVGTSKYTYVTGISGTTQALSLADGTYEWGVRAKDGAGYYSARLWGADITVDLSAPEVSVTAGAQKKTGTNKASVTLSWKSSETASYMLLVDGSVRYSGTGSKTTLTALADGTHNYILSATDAAGNTSTKSGSFVTDTIAPTKPATLTAAMVNKKVCFSWGAATDASAVSYELAYRVAGTETYTTSKGLKAITRTLTLAENTYEWRVRAKDAKGNYSAWVNGKSVKVDLTAPKVSYMATTQKKTAVGKATVTLTWKCNETASYVVKVGGKQVYAGSSKKASFSLADGYHKYSITATDAAGNVSTRTGAFRVDTKAPAKAPSSLRVQLTHGGTRVALRWTGSHDISGVTYDVAFKKSTDSAYTHYKNLSDPSLILTLAGTGEYKWGVRARDGKNNVTSWVWGDSFSNSSARTAAPTAAAVASLDQELALSSGMAALSDGGCAAATCLDACTQGREKSYALLTS